MAAFRDQKFVLLIAIIFLGLIGLVFAQPYNMDSVTKDPYRKAGETTCLVCHSDESGGGLIGFGEAFVEQGMEITPLLRAHFPNLFAYPASKITDSITINFSDPENKKLVIEMGGEKAVVDVEKRTIPPEIVNMVHFSDASNNQVVIETGGKKIVVDVEKRTVDGEPASIQQENIK